MLIELAGTLPGRGRQIDAYELGEMFVHVSLEQDVRRKLAAGWRRRRAVSGGVEGEATPAVI